MDENRMSGTAKTFEGKVEEGFGRAVGGVPPLARGPVQIRALGRMLGCRE
jgi:uncharacterized protein YjbJ (UPF0337 family)